MFENEGEEGIEQETQSDVEEGSPSESQNNANTPRHEAAANKEEEQRIPYERFQEMVAHKNEAVAKQQALETRLAQMEKQFQESQKVAKPEPSDPMYDRLKGIDPEFADYLKEVRSQAGLAKELQDQLNGMKQEQFVNSALSKFDELTKANNVSPELANLYKASIDLQYREGKISNLSDLEKTYTDLHSKTSKFLQTQERSIIEKYTASKKSDARSPTGQPKGKAPTQTGKTEFSSDPTERKAQMVKIVADSLRAGRDQL